jgi:hypothetical protein
MSAEAYDALCQRLIEVTAERDRARAIAVAALRKRIEALGWLWGGGVTEAGGVERWLQLSQVLALLDDEAES